MASSSTHSGPFSTTHDVFLSFRGIDSRKIIVDPLCTALNLEGMRTFFHEHELEGEVMSSQVQPAAKMSKTTIVVLSESYASSGWCLDELVEILELMDTEKQHVITIFYHVDQVDVIHQTGGFGTAFRKHTDMMKTDTWKLALNKIGRFPGYHLPNARTWLDPELISGIVTKVKLEISNSELLPSGTHRSFSSIPGTENIKSSDSGLLGGKDSHGSDMKYTELNEVGALASYDGSAVLETDPNRMCQDIGAPNIVSGSQSMPEICHKPIALPQRHISTNIPSGERRALVRPSRKLVSTVLPGSKDSDSPEKSANYSKELSTVPPGQKDSKLPKESGEAPAPVMRAASQAYEWKWDPYMMSSLSTTSQGYGWDPYMSSISFASQDYGWNPQIYSLETLQKEWVNYCKEPSSLDDEIGVLLDFQESYYNLFDIKELLRLLKKNLGYNVLQSKHVLVRNLKVMDIWVSKLSEIPNNLSFPDLEKLFLYTNSDSKNIPDSFFKGRPVVHYSNLELKYIPPSFFERMPSLKELNLTNSRMKTLPPSVLKLINLEKLILKGCSQLIEIPHNISALENLTALDLTECTNLVELPESINFPQSLSSLDLTRCDRLTKLPSSICKLRFLKYIHLSGCSSLFESHSAELGIERLSWDNQADEMEIDMDYHERLVVGEAGNKRHGPDLSKLVGLIKRVLEYNFLQSKFVAVRNLKVIHISNSKIPEIPDSLSFPDLEQLILKPNVKLSHIPSSLFGKMPALRVLDMSNASIKYLPPSVFKLMKLEKLILKGCKHLTEIPHDISVLGNLKELDLSGCKSLVKLPESIGEMRFLRNLNLSGCGNFAEIPESFILPLNLYSLDLTDCKQLTKLPESVCRLRFLTKLNLSGCTYLGEIPESFQQLKNLCSLDLTNCKSLTGLPSSFSGARSLLSLSLSGCETFAEILESFEFPRNLNSLNLTDCKRLTKVPESVCRLQFLNYLSLSGCENLATFPESFGKLQKLCTLELRDCKRLTRLPESLGMLTGLQMLDLHGCTNLAEIPEAIESLKSLISLDLTDCESLTKLPESISEIPYLRNIKLSGCSSLVEFHGPQVSVKCLSWNICQPNRKQVELDFHETQGTPSDITEILGLMEKVLQHQLLKSEKLEVAVIKLKVIHTSKSKVPEIPKKLRFPDLEKLVLQPDIDFISSFTSSFFKRLPTFKVLDMSHTHIKTLPSWVYKLTDLKGLILQRCELLTELPDGIGALENLELLDLEGTDLVCLPNELGKLINLKCLKVLLYDDESYRKSKKIIDIIPTAVLSKLTKLEELSINFDPQDVWCSALVKAILADLLSLRKLNTLKLYLPTTELLQNLMELKSNEDVFSVHKNLSNFTVIIGPHGQRFISRLPCGLEEEYLKLKKCLKYISGKDSTSEFADALKHANALYLDRHWNIQKLSVFKADELNKLKFCMLVDCNEMQTVFDASDFRLEDNSFSLQYLAIHYLENLKEIGKGPSVGCCLQALKVLVLHMCPSLTTIFTPVLLGDLVNLEEIIVEDCAKITSLIAKDSTQLNGTEYLPRLKKMTLLYLPKLESISSGISIGPELENIIIYDCPKLKTLPSLGVHNVEVIKIKGEGEWWNALEWIGGRPQYLHNAFSELDTEGDFLHELATQYVNSLRLFVECNAD